MRPIVATLLAALALLPASRAAAYSVHEGAHGEAAAWDVAQVDVIADRSLKKLGEGALDAARAAFAAWDGADGAYAPLVTLTEGNADAVGYRTGRDNHSTVRFAPHGFAKAAGALAVTVLSYDADGRILDADIVVNGASKRAFAQMGEAPSPKALSVAPGTYDLQNVLTHEAGHFIGLGEEVHDTEATMFYESAPGETKKRTLDADDEAGARSLYPHGVEVGSSSCAAAPVRPRSGAPWMFAALGAGALLFAAGARRSRGRHARGALVAAIAAPALAFGVTSPPASTGSPAPATPAALLAVARVEPRWEGGLVVSHVVVRGRDDAGEESEHALDVLGGTCDGITQRVGHGEVPRAGDRVDPARAARWIRFAGLP